MRILYDLTGELDVLFITVVRTVDHDGGESAVDAALAEFERIAMVEMDADGQVRFDAGGFDQLHEVGVVGVLARAGADLQDQRGVEFLGRLGDALDDLHVVDVERADSVAAGIRVRKHFFAGYDRHMFCLLFNESV
ncbi:hypothetical protein SDC9_198436 [bioreactor metagenome]|uniref:Uncharacterized protein n=1 Tax=bioreactor metagenome TaxID=1076179 RepID=A0A645IHN0_9ZZZZ